MARRLPGSDSPAELDRHLKIAIIGGGPTGLLTSVLLSRRGIQSTVVERGRWPIDKVCGEGIMPHGVALLRQHGILDRIDPEWSRPFTGVRYINKDGRGAVGEFRGEPGLTVRRTALSKALFETAAAEPLVSLLPGHELISFQEDDEQVRVTIKDLELGTKKELAGFTYLIGADGLKSKVRRLNQMNGVAPGLKPNRMGARVHYCIKPWDDKVQVWWQDGIEAYVAPTSENCVEFNFGWDLDSVDAKAHTETKNLETGLFAYFPELATKVRGAERLSRLQSWGPLPHRAKAPIIGRIALLGDAGLFYDQITGEGLSLGFLQAELAANTISDWHTQAGRDKFVNTFVSVAKNYIQVTDLALFMTRHPLIRTLMFRLLARSPALFSHVLHANMGEVSLVRPALGHIVQAILRPQS